MTSGHAESFITKLPLARGTRDHHDVLATLHIEFDRETPVSTSICMLPITPKNLNSANMQYFEPAYVKYRPAHFVQRRQRKMSGVE